MIVGIEKATLRIDGNDVALAEMRAGKVIIVDSDTDTIVYIAPTSDGVPFMKSVRYVEAFVEVKQSGTLVTVKTANEQQQTSAH